MRTSGYRLIKLVIAAVFLLGITAQVSAQAGLIIKPASTAEARSILDPNGDGNIFHPSPNTFEIPFYPLPKLMNEPAGDPTTGATNGHTDMLPGPLGTESPSYMYYDPVKEVFIFRMRLGKASSASKGYTYLFNTDQNNFGPGAISQSNPGFQYEIALLSGFGVRLFDHTNGTSYTLPGGPEAYWQTTVAEETSKVFYDFYVPLSEIIDFFGIDLSATPFRVAATTVTSAQSGVAGTASDISGIVDNSFNSSIQALMQLIQSAPVVTGSTLDEMNQVVPRAPSIFGPLLAGANKTISGSSLDIGATIQLYINGVAHPTTAIVQGNNQWSITGLTLNQDDAIYAVAISGALTSNPSTTLYVGLVTQCTQAPENFNRSGNTVTGFLYNIQGVNHVSDANTNLIIRVYNSNGERIFSTTTADSPTPKVTLAWNAGTQQFTLSGSGNPFNSLTAGNFYVTAQLSGQCESIGGVETGVKTAVPVITTSPILVGQVTVSGTAVAGSTVFLYQNGVQIGSPVTATGGNWSVNVSAATLVEGRLITARAQSSGQIISDPSAPVPVGSLQATSLHTSWVNTQEAAM